MNINSNELLLINQKLKFKGEGVENGTEGSSVNSALTNSAETPVSTPESTMNALNLQGMNNIAFQGNKLAALKKLGLSTVAALSLFAGSAALTSCSDDPEIINQPPVIIENEVNVTVDFSAMQAFYNKMLDLYQQMLEQQQITNNQLNNLTAQLLKFMQMYENGQASANEFYDMMYNFMLQNDANQKALIELLTQNNMSQEEANKLIQELIQQVKDGKISAAKAFEQIMKALNDINISLSQIATLHQQLLDVSNKLLEENQLTNEQLSDIQAQLDKFMQMYKNGQIDAKKYYAMMYDFMRKNDINQKIIINLLVKNNMSQEEANKLLKELIEKVENGKMTSAEAFAEIIRALGGIQNTLDGILDTLKSISEKIDQNHKEYMEAKDQELSLLGGIYKNGKIQTKQLAILIDLQKKMGNKLDQLNLSVNELLEIAKDPSKFEALMEQLKNMDKNSVDYSKFEAMFEMLGLKLTDVINSSTTNITDAIKLVNDSIKNFQNTYIENESNQTELLANINNKLAIIATMPGLDQSAIIDAISRLEDAINNGSENIGNDLTNISNQLDAILAKIDKMISEIGNISATLTSFVESFDGKFEANLENLIKAMKENTTSIINAINDAKQEQKVANQYLQMLLNKADEIYVAIDNINSVGGNGGMTVEEFVNAMKERDEAQFAKYEALIKSLGLKIDNTNIKLDELKELIKGAIQDKKDYSEQLNRIITILEGLNLNPSSPDYSAKLDKIIELITNFKCNCECGGNKGNNEGILDDLENLG